MKYSLTLVSIGLLTVAITGCSFNAIHSPFGGGSVSSFSSSSVSSEYLEEVSYTGTVEKLGVSIYMEGTHRLDIGGGEYLLLESDIFNLDDFVGEEVRVTGVVRPTVESGSRIMRVSQIASLLSQSSDSSSSESTQASDDSSSEALSSAASSVASSVPPPPPPIASSSKSSVVPPPPPPVSSASSSTVATEGARSSQTAAMAKVKTDASNWTQQYCSSHIGFCVALHKNWWYKSFGATDTELWHVEASASEINVLGDGAVVISFLSGSLPSGTADYAVTTDGEDVVGYRSWTGKRHFEIRAPQALRSSVEYMVQNLTTYEAPIPQ